MAGRLVLEFARRLRMKAQSVVPEDVDDRSSVGCGELLGIRGEMNAVKEYLEL